MSVVMTSEVAGAAELKADDRGAILEGDAGGGGTVETIPTPDAEAGRAAPVEVAEMA